MSRKESFITMILSAIAFLALVFLLPEEQTLGSSTSSGGLSPYLLIIPVIWILIGFFAKKQGLLEGILLELKRKEISKNPRTYEDLSISTSAIEGFDGQERLQIRMLVADLLLEAKRDEECLLWVKAGSQELNKLGYSSEANALKDKVKDLLNNEDMEDGV